MSDSENTSGIYGSPYFQWRNQGRMGICLSIPIGVTGELFLHVVGTGRPFSPALNEQPEIIDFQPEHLHQCTGLCKEERPGNLKRMFPISQEVVNKIRALHGFQEAVSRASRV